MDNIIYKKTLHLYWTVSSLRSFSSISSTYELKSPAQLPEIFYFKLYKYKQIIYEKINLYVVIKDNQIIIIILDRGSYFFFGSIISVVNNLYFSPLTPNGIYAVGFYII